MWSDSSVISVLHCLRVVMCSIPVGSCAFFSHDIWWLSVGPCSGMVPNRFGDESSLAGGNCRRPIVWLDNSVVIVLERRSAIPGRVVCFFLPCDTWWLSVSPC